MLPEKPKTAIQHLAAEHGRRIAMKKLLTLSLAALPVLTSAGITAAADMTAAAPAPAAGAGGSSSELKRIGAAPSLKQQMNARATHRKAFKQ